MLKETWSHVHWRLHLPGGFPNLNLHLEYPMYRSVGCWCGSDG